uniref:Uncharacterized protein n=2 Tax=Arion vulgaris TaxID=1028688 RepID=A0A0B6ZSW9_9EUPU
MSKFKNRIKTKIIKQREVETLKHDIRQKNRRINELMDTIKEKLKENAQLHRKKQKRFDTDQELQLIRYSEIMKGYRELMQAVATTS